MQITNAYKAGNLDIKKPQNFSILGSSCFIKTRLASTYSAAGASGVITSLSRANNFSLIRADLPERSRK
jgi:hypothetical protein